MAPMQWSKYRKPQETVWSHESYWASQSTQCTHIRPQNCVSVSRICSRVSLIAFRPLEHDSQPLLLHGYHWNLFLLCHNCWAHTHTHSACDILLHFVYILSLYVPQMHGCFSRRDLCFVSNVKRSYVYGSCFFCVCVAKARQECAYISMCVCVPVRRTILCLWDP